MSHGSVCEAPGGVILVVDDHPVIRGLLADLVALLGHQVTVAENGRQALELLRARNFDLVLLDVEMPELDGYKALEQIKDDAALRTLPIIMVSGLGEIDSVVRCIEAGAEDYLTKPFDPVLLRARISACLEKKRLRDAERHRAEELEKALAQLKALQDQLVTQEKLASLGTLTAGIAHEIRNPLTFVIGFAEGAVGLIAELRELLRRPDAPRPEIEEVLTELERSAGKVQEHGRRADQIVSSMLLHARGQGGERCLTDLNALVKEYVQLAYHGLRSQCGPGFQVVIETDLDKSLPPLPLFAQEISRTVVNLTLNACYAAHEKKQSVGAGFAAHVRVSTRARGDEVEVRFRDNGNGIPAALRDKIFMPFFTTKPAGAGTGLGLSISYDIVVRLHGGKLQVESEEGRYAELIVSLPRTTER